MDSYGYTIQLDPSTDQHLALYLYQDVENSKEIKAKIMKGELNCCFIKAELVNDPFQVIVAANKSVLRQKSNNLSTKSIFTEILYTMSSSNNISLSLKLFGINDDDRNIIVAILYKNDEELLNTSKNISNVIKGTIVPFTNLKDITDRKELLKIYKIDSEELKVSSLTDSIVSRIAGLLY